jgi:uncharacterized membrane protein YeaQ/YmgE (transglycosylase-associated protein family)
MYVPPPARPSYLPVPPVFAYVGIALALGGGLLGAIILAFIGAVILLVIVKVIKQLTA